MASGGCGHGTAVYGGGDDSRVRSHSARVGGSWTVTASQLAPRIRSGHACFPRLPALSRNLLPSVEATVAAGCSRHGGFQLIAVIETEGNTLRKKIRVVSVLFHQLWSVLEVVRSCTRTKRRLAWKGIVPVRDESSRRLRGCKPSAGSVCLLPSD